jgi:hypothetical protein
MSKLTDVFLALLDSSSPPALFQQRIYEYASRNKLTALLVKLASHPNIDPTVDDLLKSVRTAQVVAARLSNPARSSEEIVSTLENESRVSVLSAIADHPALTADAQRTIATKVSNRNVLLGLVKNPNVEDEIRLLAAKNFVSISRSPSDACMNIKRVSQMFEIEDTLNGFLERSYMESNDLELLYAAAQRYPIDDEAQLRLVSGFLSRYMVGLSIVEPSTSYYAYNDAQSQLLDIAELLAERGLIGAAAHLELLNGLDRTLSCFGKGTYSRKRFEAVRKEVKRAKTDRFKKYRDHFDSVTTEEEMSDFVERILKAYRSSDELSSTFMLTVSNQLAMSPVATADHLVALLDNIHVMEGPALVKVANTPAKQAVVFMESLFHISNCDSIMDNVSDPDALLREIIMLINKTSSFSAVSTVASSRHFKPEHWKLFSIDTLLSCEDMAGRADKLIELFEDAVSQYHIFEALETLSGEFEGSIEDLLNVASKI